MNSSISICICTFRRPERLAALLQDLAGQTCLPAEVVVVDNDNQCSARATVQRLAIELNSVFKLVYASQPQQNISLTRNMAVHTATGEWLGLLDDDERVIPEWLQHLTQTQQRYQADGVLAPVVCQVPDSAPAWIRRGDFYSLPRFKTGEVPQLNRIGIGNALIRASLLHKEPGPFDAAFGLTGGEDADLLNRLALHHQAHFVWCDEALATEPVEGPRLSLKWLLRRALRGGQDHARLYWAGRFGVKSAPIKLLFIGRSLAQMLVAGALVPLSLLLGRHRAVKALRLVAGNLGKLTGLLGWHHQEYAAPPSKPAANDHSI